MLAAREAIMELIDSLDPGDTNLMSTSRCQLNESSQVYQNHRITSHHARSMALAPVPPLSNNVRDENLALLTPLDFTLVK